MNYVFKSDIRKLCKKEKETRKRNKAKQEKKTIYLTRQQTTWHEKQKWNKENYTMLVESKSITQVEIT